MATICAKCVSSKNLEPGAPRANAWYNWLCTDNTVKHTKGTDPVSGADIWMNEDGYQEEYEYPYCREVNGDGHCPLYVSKT